MRRLIPLLALLASCLTAVVPAHAATTAQLRVNQAGYLPGETQLAVLMTSAATPSAPVRVYSGTTVVYSGTASATDNGAWNATYAHTYDVPFQATAIGTYRLEVDANPTLSATIDVVSPSTLYLHMLIKGATFDRLQRDGANVVSGPINRAPSHLNDASATVYAWPTFNNNDEITDSTLHPIGGPIDVAGGWFDAGDYVKFTHTAAFADVLLQVARRTIPRGTGAAAVNYEAQFGLDWLSKMWEPNTGVLYLQVGIGSGTHNGKYLGDHDLWRLPEVDDGDTARADVFAAAHRPVFAANSPGQKISPNLAGRVAAAFALAAQNDAHSIPARAQAELSTAQQILANAATTNPPRPLVTALPHDFYPESTWRDDLELGYTEVALAAQRLGLPSTSWVTQAATWASAYLGHESGGDTFNLYDDSALAHHDLAVAMAAAGGRYAVTRTQLVADLNRQLRRASTVAAASPFHAVADVTNYDVDSHTFGIIATDGWYRDLAGPSAYDQLASQARAWVFGANPWGESFMIGVGTTFPHCPQHQIANISGSLQGGTRVAVGAVVNGPNGAGQFRGGLGGYMDGMRRCGVYKLAQFDGQGSRFVDDVRAWQSSEPAIDMTATAIAAASTQLQYG